MIQDMFEPEYFLSVFEVETPQGKVNNFFSNYNSY